MALSPEAKAKLSASWVGRPGYVSNAPLREAFERSGFSFYELARLVDAMRIVRYPSGNYRVGPDCQRVRRVLGYYSVWNSRGRRDTQRFVREETALRYAKALGLDPVDIGL